MDCLRRSLETACAWLKLTLLAVILAGCATAEISRPESPLLLISLDGMMPSQIEKTETPNLDRLKKQGASADRLIPVFPSKTFPVHYSVVTGLYPEQHGIISNRFDDPELEGVFRYGSPAGSDPSDWWGGEPVWVTLQKAGGRSATLFWPGSDEGIGGVFPTRYLPYDGQMGNRQRIDKVVEWLDPNGEVRADFATLYMSDVDRAGHRYGPYAAETLAAVRELDRRIGDLLDQLEQVGLAGTLNLIVMSDHGMAELSDGKVIFLDSLIEMDHVEVVDWSPVALLRPVEGKAGELYRALSERQDGYRIYRKEEVPDRYRFREHRRIPELVMVADPGYSITTRPYYYGRGLPAGMHGYDPDTEAMRGILLINGPGVNVGGRLEQAYVVDLYELMCRLLGLSPAPNEGDPEALTDLLDGTGS